MARRGQLVLAAAVLLVVALVPVTAAYLQLGAHPDVRPPAPDHAADATRFLERATVDAGSAVDGRYDWRERDQAVAAARAALDSRIDTLERARLDSGVAYHVRYNRSAAAAWAARNCPGGSGRAFGECDATAGVVVQERAGEATLVAVAYDVTVTTREGEVRLTRVVDPW